jgi:hypothetical protein
MSIYPKGRFGEAHRQPGVVEEEHFLLVYSRIKDDANKNDKKLTVYPKWLSEQMQVQQHEQDLQAY